MEDISEGEDDLSDFEFDLDDFSPHSFFNEVEVSQTYTKKATWNCRYGPKRKPKWFFHLEPRMLIAFLKYNTYPYQWYVFLLMYIWKGNRGRCILYMHTTLKCFTDESHSLFRLQVLLGQRARQEEWCHSLWIRTNLTSSQKHLSWILYYSLPKTPETESELVYEKSRLKQWWKCCT